MKKIIYSTIILMVLFINTGVSISSDRLDGTFANIYPEPFLSTTIGKTTLIVGSAIVVGAITYISAGTGTAATAGPIATWVGTQIGTLAGYSGIAATNYGLALLGGGAVSSGGLGILGGISTLNALGDVAISLAFTEGEAIFPKPYNKYQMIKIKIPEKGADNVLSIIKKIDKLKKRFEGDDVDPSFFQLTVKKRYIDALNAIRFADTKPKYIGYDCLLKAILAYNLMRYDVAKDAINDCQYLFDKKPVIYYVGALLDLTEGDYTSAEDKLNLAIAEEDDAVQPYILLSQLLIDENKYAQANFIVKLGLEKADDDNFNLSLSGGNIQYFHLHNYDAAIDYYKNALANMTVNEFEAECKLMIAKCYRKKGNTKKAQKWLGSALDEVSKNAPYKKSIYDSWINGDN